MFKRAFRLSHLPIAALGLAAAGLGFAALTLGNGDAVVERGFQRAFANMDGNAAPNRGPLPVVAGSEEFWLTHLVHDAGGGAVTKPVAVGDRITINSGGGERVLHVVTVDKLDETIGRMRGVPGTQVKLAVGREGEPEPLLFTLERGEVHVHSVRAEPLPGDFG